MGHNLFDQTLTNTIATFYRFVPLPDYKELQCHLKEVGLKLGIRGIILLAPEGINSTISGDAKDLSEFFRTIGRDERLANLECKFSHSNEHPFGKLRVRLKKEIVRMKVDGLDLDQVGEYVPPADWNDLISQPGMTLVDVRNRYESEIGTFANATIPNTDEFWEFPQWVAENLTDKSKPVALFCTGGIRCEKATSYLMREGFKKVFHLQGGILKYLEDVPASESLWQGDCFVFDRRKSVDQNLEPSYVISPSEMDTVKK